jgi:hypothetical protein
MDLQSFQRGSFSFVFICLCFWKDSWSSREGGSYYFFKEGDLKTILRGRGRILLSDPPTPFFNLPAPPASRKNSIFRRARNWLFKLLKIPFEKHPCYKFPFEHTSFFHKKQSFHRAPAKQKGASNALVGQGRGESKERQETRGCPGKPAIAVILLVRQQEGHARIRQKYL